MLTTPNLQIPEMPHGYDFARDSFWWTYRERFVRARRVKESAWDWFERERRRAALRNEDFPPEPLFGKLPPPMPQVWTGKDERAGRMPREGK